MSSRATGPRGVSSAIPTPAVARSSSLRPTARIASKLASAPTASQAAPPPSQPVVVATKSLVASAVIADRRGTSQLKKAEQTLQEKAKSLEVQLEQTRTHYSEEVRRLQAQLQKHIARQQEEEEQEGSESFFLLLCSQNGRCIFFSFPFFLFCVFPARSKDLLAEAMSKISQLEEEKGQLEKLLESAGFDAVGRKKVRAQENAKAKIAISEIRERVRSEATNLQDIQNILHGTADDNMEIED